MGSNAETVNAYETHVQKYIDGTPQQVDGYFREWIDRSLGYLPANAHILELGSAFGRDAVYMESAGFTVERTDVTQGFVYLLKSKGFEARKLNALTDELGGSYDMVFANAVLLHFTLEEFRLAVSKAKGSLAANGILSFTLKQGRGSGWSEEKLGVPRFFQYWQQDDLRQEITDAGFDILSLESDPDNKWLATIAQRQTL
jgi:hypothetical protein